MTDAPMRYTLRLTPAGQGFVGRHDLIGQLDQAWADQSTRLVALVGLGGSGKSWLIDRWRSKLDRQGDLYRVGVFGWRFESPGRIAQHTDAAEQFFDQLAEELGVSSGGPTAPIDKADWLARALRGRRTLLILDGLEAVQGRDGALHDKALQFVHPAQARTWPLWQNVNMAREQGRIDQVNALLGELLGDGFRELYVHPEGVDGRLLNVHLQFGWGSIPVAVAGDGVRTLTRLALGVARAEASERASGAG